MPYRLKQVAIALAGLQQIPGHHPSRPPWLPKHLPAQRIRQFSRMTCSVRPDWLKQVGIALAGLQQFPGHHP